MLPTRSATVSSARPRTQAEAAQCEAVYKLNLKLSHLGDGVLEIDARGRIRNLNAAAEQLTGWCSTEARGRRVKEVIHLVDEETREPVTVSIEEVMHTVDAGGLCSTWMLVSRDGKEHAVFGSAAPIRGADRKVRGAVLVLRDVGGRRAEDALRASEARYREFIELSPLGVFVHCNGDLVYLNPKALALFGASSEQELVGRPVLDLLHADSREGARERIRLVNFEGIAVPARAAKWLRVDGSSFYGESTAVPCEHQGQPAALVLLQDVTARTEAEQERDRFFELSLDLMCVAGSDGFKRVNPAFTRTLGWSQEELTTRPFLDFVHPDDVATTRRQLEKLATGEPLLHFENRYRCKDGSWRWLSWNSAPTPEGLRYSTARDTTREHEIAAVLHRLNADLEQRVQMLRDKEQEIGAIVNNLADCIVMIDSRGTIRRVNPALKRILGYTPEEVVGQGVSLLMPDPQRAQHAGYLERYLRTGEARIIGSSREVEGRHKDGHLIPLELSITEYLMDGERLFLGTLRDIRERKAFIAELTQARAEAEQASQAKSAFLATMSHEIRTPMNGVIGLVDVLMHSKLSEHQAELVGTVRQSASALLGIIDDILDFSKIEAGRLDFERTPVDLTNLVEGLSASLVPVAARKDVDISLFISPNLPECVLSDEVRLRQVLYNLLGNAIKFSGGRPNQRGRVALRVGPAGQSPLRIAFAISDNGIGMAPETLGQLFTPFTQADVATTRRFGGTGLGLAICKRLVELMDGEITVASKPGEGSTFMVSLPFDVPATQAVRQLPDLSGVDCVLLEGEEINTDDVRVYLEHAGARFHLAEAKAALQIAAGKRTPVVIIHEAARERPDPALRELFASAPDVRHLVITRGRRRRPRVEGPETVTLDGSILRRHALVRAVAVAAGRASPEQFQPRSAEELMEAAAPISIAEARATGRLILVAEDDDINQKVILQQLRLLGYAAEVAANGVEALQLWKQGGYALLLTDLHMPELDGYALAQAVRRQEAGQARMPILALTANALRGEANRARAVGMDGYLTKPIQLTVLKAALEQWMPSAGTGTTPAPELEAAGNGQTAPILDVEVLRGMVGDDPEVVEEFLRDYLVSVQRLSGELRAARDSGNTREVGAIAHKLKSSSRSVGALQLGDRCAELENASKAGDKSAITQHAEQFEAVLAEVEAKIGGLLADK
jgi:PAS domain S-box-containing protein